MSRFALAASLLACAFFVGCQGKDSPKSDTQPGASTTSAGDDLSAATGKLVVLKLPGMT